MSKAITEKYRIEFGIIGIHKLQEYQRGLQATNNELSRLKKKIREQVGATNAQANKLTRLTAQQQLYNAKVKEGIKNLKGNASRLREYGSQTKKTTKSMGNMAAKAIAALAAFRQLSTFLVTSVKDFAAYERGVKNVSTLLSADDKSMFSPSLYEGVLSVSTEFGFKINDVNKALFNSVSAGVNAANSINFLKDASTLAIAGVTDLKSAALGLTTVINAYGMEAKDAARVSEILFTTQKFGVTTVEELSKSIGVVVPFAAASGISFEELGAAISVTTRSGLDAAKTVTALRAAISQMQKPAAESIDLFTKYGIPIGSAELKATGFTETLRRLNEVYKESPRDIERMFGNVRGLTAIFSLAGDNAAEYGRFLQDMTTDTGDASSIQRALAENMDSTDVAIQRLDAAFKNLKVTIGDSEFIKDLIKETTTFLEILASDDLSFTEKLFFGKKGKERALKSARLRAKLERDKDTREILKESEEDIEKILKAIDDKVALTPQQETDALSLIKLIPSLEQVNTKGDIFIKEMDKVHFETLESLKNHMDEVQAQRDADSQKEKDAAQAKADLIEDYRNQELISRNKLNLDLHEANKNFALKDEVTSEQMKNHKLNLIQIELDSLNELMLHKGISGQQEVDLRKRIDTLLLKQIKVRNNHEINEEKRKLSVVKNLQQDALNKATSFITESLSISLENKQKDFDAEKEKIDKEVEFGLISKKQAEKEKEKIDKEAFRTRKKHEKKMALINYIKELTNIRVQAAANPLNAVTFGAAGISQYAILAALATAAYAGNLANINAQKFAKGGMVHGNSHAQGGEKFAVGGRVVELEGGEAVINKRSTAMFGDTLSAMNVAGGGTSFSAPNFGSKDIINYRMLADAVSKNINVVLPVESLNKVQNKVKVIESQSKY